MTEIPSQTTSRGNRPVAAVLSVVLTGAAVLYIFMRVDWSQLARFDLDADWTRLGAGIAVIVGIYLTSALRWMVLFQGRLEFRAACLAIFIGHGCNAILPARGGDIVKLFYLRNAWGIGLSGSVIRLLTEKVLDLTGVMLLSLLSLTLLFGNLMLARALLLCAAFALVLLMYMTARSRAIPGALIRRLCSFARLPAAVADRPHEMLQDLSGLLHSKQFARAAGLTALIWFVFEYVLVVQIARGVNVELDYLSALLVVGFGALGIGLPGAPAGIGVYHAAVMGALELAGYPAEQGLIIATVLHLANTLPVVVLAGICYAASQQWPGGGRQGQ
jgi:hypothetical protein